MDEQTALNELVSMSLTLGKPENDYVILGEGNTSAKVNDDLFFVKASGKYLSKSEKDTFVKVRLKDAQAILDSGDLTDEEIKNGLLAVCADPENKLRPSVETTFHAFLLSLPGINFVGHTHPTAVNSLLCSVGADEVIKGRIFPDEIVYCGIRPIYLEYVDPGLQLARTIREASTKFLKDEGCVPKVILIQNHGLIALGSTAHEVEAITAMWCKTCKVLAGTHAFGGPHYFTRENVARIYTRPDEHYRKQQL
jgi:rhamnose utilization protein RhaD (predicted bifunctional aldolase and dehydrogenase)